ncbi:MAG: hypothetical protein WBA62_07355 [Xanthobacteraceae bacterium]
MRVEGTEYRDIDREHPDRDQPQPCRGAEIKESQQRDRENPWDGRRGNAAVEVTTPQNAEDQVLNRNQRQRVIWHPGAQSERKDPEGADREGKNGDREIGVRIEHIECNRNDAADKGAKDMADQEDMSAVARIAIGVDFCWNEVIHQAIQRGDHPSHFIIIRVIICHENRVAFCEGLNKPAFQYCPARYCPTRGPVPPSTTIRRATMHEPLGIIPHLRAS